MTYSIVAGDPEDGPMGLATQSLIELRRLVEHTWRVSVPLHRQSYDQ